MVADKALAASRVELLDLGFSAASAMPVAGHGKSRSRAQEAVVNACFELEQPQRALAFAHQIEDWRRGAAYADYAFYCAEHGAPSAGRAYLDLAEEIAESDPLARAQEWRRDRIRVNVARTYSLLGEQKRARELEQGVVDSEVGKLDAVRVAHMDPAQFDERLSALDTVLETGSFDQVRNALDACVVMHERFFRDAERRALLEDRVRTSYSKLPLMIRVDLMEALVEASVLHGSLEHALDLVVAVEGMVDSSMWSVEYKVPLLARMASLRASVGDEAGARAAADASWEHYQAQGEEIVSLFRCEALLPLAAAYHQVGAREQSQAVYLRALVEGADNPNGRQRAEDLSAVCRALAIEGVAPGDELHALLLSTLSGLSAPW